MSFDSGWFFQEADSVIFMPAVIGFPGSLLALDAFRAHHRRSRKQAKESELSEAAEEEPRGRRDSLEPFSRDFVMNVRVKGERDPNVDVREKK